MTYKCSALSTTSYRQLADACVANTLDVDAARKPLRRHVRAVLPLVCTLNSRDKWFFLRKNHELLCFFGVHLRENCSSCRVNVADNIRARVR